METQLSNIIFKTHGTTAFGKVCGFAPFKVFYAPISLRGTLIPKIPILTIFDSCKPTF